LLGADWKSLAEGQTGAFDPQQTVLEGLWPNRRERIPLCCELFAFAAAGESQGGDVERDGAAHPGLDKPKKAEGAASVDWD
jgi:hypothetical protein